MKKMKKNNGVIYYRDFLFFNFYGHIFTEYL